MGLLDSILGSMAGGAQQQSGMGTKAALVMALLSMMMNKGASASQGSGELGNILGSLAGEAVKAAEVWAAFSAACSAAATRQAPRRRHNLEGALGGLRGIRDLFQKAGLGEHVDSWIGTGDNQPVSADQIKQALGDSGHLGQLAQAAGVTEHEAAHDLSELLPDIVNSSPRKATSRPVAAILSAC